MTPETVLAWQRKLTKEGGRKDGKGLAANTVRLARARLAGAFKMALGAGIVALSPMVGAPRPRAERSIPRHWTPEQAREFLALMDGDRTWPVWAFLLGSGLRIGELGALRWRNVDLNAPVVRVVEFVSTLGHETVTSTGKSWGAVRTIDLDRGLVHVLLRQRKLQATEQLAAVSWEESDYVFTKPGGGPYHPQYLSKLLRTYTAELGLPRLTAHGLRHTSATLMLASGVPPKVAADRLGHADPTLFTNLYSHVTPTMQRDAPPDWGRTIRRRQSQFGTLRPRVQIPPSLPGQGLFLLSTGGRRPHTDHRRCGLRRSLSVTCAGSQEVLPTDPERRSSSSFWSATSITWRTPTGGAACDKPAPIPSRYWPELVKTHTAALGRDSTRGHRSPAAGSPNDRSPWLRLKLPSDVVASGRPDTRPGRALDIR